jgi:hypothetical protein
LKSVDLPTLGRPKITNDGSICVMVSSGRRTIENRNSAATFTLQHPTQFRSPAGGQASKKEKSPGLAGALLFTAGCREF